MHFVIIDNVALISKVIVLLLLEKAFCTYDALTQKRYIMRNNLFSDIIQDQQTAPRAPPVPWVRQAYLVLKGSQALTGQMAPKVHKVTTHRKVSCDSRKGGSESKQAVKDVRACTRRSPHGMS